MLITSDIERIADLFAQKPAAVIAYPTETFYGLGTLAHDRAGIERIITLKGRAAAKGMIVLVSDLDMAREMAIIDADQAALLARFWPAPLSAVLPARPGLPATLCPAGKIALRISPHPTARELVKRVGPLTSTSANPAGATPASTPAEVLALKIDALLDGGRTPGRQPSTLVDFTTSPPTCLRHGAFAFATIEKAWAELLKY